jgi:hypothetical protein
MTLSPVYRATVGPGGSECTSSAERANGMVFAAGAMTAEEAQRFLSACEEVCPEYHAFFFTALRAGSRKGELIALQWGDLQFSESEADRNASFWYSETVTWGNLERPRTMNAAALT